MKKNIFSMFPVKIYFEIKYGISICLDISSF